MLFCSLRANIPFRYDGRLNYKDLNDNSLLNGVQTEALVGASDFLTKFYFLFLRLGFGLLNSLSPMLWVLSRFVFNSYIHLLNDNNWGDQKFCIHFFLWYPLIFQNCQTVVDELSVATIVLENNPWHDDISQSLECKILLLQLACYIISLRLWIQCLWELSEPSKGILPGVCLWIWPALLSIWHTGKFDK